MNTRNIPGRPLDPVSWPSARDTRFASTRMCRNKISERVHDRQRIAVGKSAAERHHCVLPVTSTKKARALGRKIAALRGDKPTQNGDNSLTLWLERLP
jgi:hypothetical protein